MIVQKFSWNITIQLSIEILDKLSVNTRSQFVGLYLAINLPWQILRNIS